MKKILFIIVALIIVSGCTTKQEILTCVYDETVEDYKIETLKEIKFDNSMITNFKEEIITTPTIPENIEYLDSFISINEKQFAGLIGKKGITFENKVEENKHIVTINIDYEKIDLNELKDLSDIEQELINDYGKKISIDKTLEASEDNGYKCTKK